MADHLLDGEHLVLRAHRHWVLLARSLWLPVALLTIAFVGDEALAGRVSLDIRVTFTLVALALAGLVAIVTWLQWAATSLTVTDQRVLLVSGVFSRVSKVIALDRVQDVSTRQGLTGRMLGYGTVEIDAAGTGGAETLDHVPRPAAVRDEIYVQSERLRRPPGPGAAAAPST